MTGLRELFEEAAGSAPPSRLLADDVYTAGRRRWHRRRLAVAGCSAAAAVAVLAASLLATARPPVDETPIADGSTAPTTAGPFPGQRLQWVDSTDATHLYLLSTCTTPGTCDKSLGQLKGSDDGGRTWTDRGTLMRIGPMAVLGPRVLVAAAQPDQPGATRASLMISTDGGHHWIKAQEAPAVDAVPGGMAICWPETAGPSCTMQVVDPVSHRVAPLSHQPPLTLQPDGPRIDELGGRLWVPGREPGTGRPAVAVSADAGRTWATHVFRDAPSCPSADCQPLAVAVDGSGKTVYVVANGEPHLAIYRLTGDATRSGWQRLTDTGEIPRGTNGYRSFVTTDGTHVLFHAEDDGDFAYRYWAARDGGAYRAVELVGLPAAAGPIRQTPHGWFYAIGRSDNVVYGSTDGWHWSPVTSR